MAKNTPNDTKTILESLARIEKRLDMIEHFSKSPIGKSPPSSPGDYLDELNRVRDDLTRSNELPKTH